MKNIVSTEDSVKWQLTDSISENLIVSDLESSPSIMKLLFLKAKLSIFARGLIFVDQLP